MSGFWVRRLGFVMLLLLPTVASAQKLPDTDIFNRNLRLCAPGRVVGADIEKQIREVYATDQSSVLALETFLNKFPIDKRQEAYRAYVECIKAIVDIHRADAVPTTQRRIVDLAVIEKQECTETVIG